MLYDLTPLQESQKRLHAIFRKHSTCSLIFANQKKIPLCRQCYYIVSILSCYTHVCEHNKNVSI